MGEAVVVVDGDPDVRLRLAAELSARGLHVTEAGTLDELAAVIAATGELTIAVDDAGPRLFEVAPSAPPLEALRGEVGRRGADPFATIIGSSPAAVELVRLLGLIAPTDAPVLITGETGTGKEVVARAIHDNGPRRGGPFVAVSCAALPEALLEAELFGHVRGAFTGAEADRRGLLFQADGGTLLLDEIGDVPLSVQRKLLRALQERRVRPIGSSQELPFDVRIISATNRDLVAAIKAGEFRDDLFFRLAVLTLELAPLRARGDDVLIFAERFLEEHRREHGGRARRISADAAERLTTYAWPGNVRELQNCIAHALALSTATAPIGPADFPARIRADDVEAAPPLAALVTLEAVERAHIALVLRAVDGNRTLAATILGCDRRTLSRKLGSRRPGARVDPARPASAPAPGRCDAVAGQGGSRA